MRLCKWGYLWINPHPYKCESIIHSEDEVIVRKDKITAYFIQGRSFHISGLPAGEENSAYKNGMKSLKGIPAACGKIL